MSRENFKIFEPVSTDMKWCSGSMPLSSAIIDRLVYNNDALSEVLVYQTERHFDLGPTTASLSSTPPDPIDLKGYFTNLQNTPNRNDQTIGLQFATPTNKFMGFSLQGFLGIQPKNEGSLSLCLKVENAYVDIVALNYDELQSMYVSDGLEEVTSSLPPGSHKRVYPSDVSGSNGCSYIKFDRYVEFLFFRSSYDSENPSLTSIKDWNMYGVNRTVQTTDQFSKDFTGKNPGKDFRILEMTKFPSRAGGILFSSPSRHLILKTFGTGSSDPWVGNVNATHVIYPPLDPGANGLTDTLRVGDEANYYDVGKVTLYSINGTSIRINNPFYNSVSDFGLRKFASSSYRISDLNSLNTITVEDIAFTNRCSLFYNVNPDGDSEFISSSSLDGNIFTGSQPQCYGFATGNIGYDTVNSAFNFAQGKPSFIFPNQYMAQRDNIGIKMKFLQTLQVDDSDVIGGGGYFSTTDPNYYNLELNSIGASGTISGQLGASGSTPAQLGSMFSSYINPLFNFIPITNRDEYNFTTNWFDPHAYNYFGLFTGLYGITSADLLPASAFYGYSIPSYTGNADDTLTSSITPTANNQEGIILSGTINFTTTVDSVNNHAFYIYPARYKR